MIKAQEQLGLDQFIQQMPKAEIHVHLEGSVAPETVLELAERNHLMHTLPFDNTGELRQWYLFQDFTHFIEVYMAVQGVLVHGEDFEQITYLNGADMAAQNIRYRELTFTPFMHIDVADKGLRIEEVLEGLEAGCQRAKRNFGVEMRWVFDVPRNTNFPIKFLPLYIRYPSNKTLEYALMGRQIGVIGLGLGGYEVKAPPEPFAHIFKKAKDHGLLSLPHAGETGGADSVWGAIRMLKADRIGHGVRAIDDPDLVRYLAERRIPLEVNPTSNICLHVYESMQEHPFRRLDEAGVPVTVNSDDPALFNTTLTGEYHILSEEFGYQKADLARIARNAFEFSGLEQTGKEGMVAEFDAWAATNL
jgi:aminodeoxyfutalosine deaminase